MVMEGSRLLPHEVLPMAAQDPDDTTGSANGTAPDETHSAAARWRIAAFAISVPFVLLGVYSLAWIIRHEARQDYFFPRGWVDLAEKGGELATAPSPEPAGRPRLRVAIAPVMSPEQSMKLYQDFVRSVARKVAREPVMLAGKNYAEVNNMVRHRQCDLALVCTFAYVRGQEEFGMEALAAPVVLGQSVYYSFILARRSLKAKSLLDLRGRRFASSDLLSASGWLFPVVWLKGKGEDPQPFFSEHLITGSHDRSVHAVASGYVDGAAVDSMVYDHVVEDDPSVKEQTTVIGSSKPFGTPPFVVHPGVDSKLKQELQAVLLALHEDTEAKHFLSALRIDRFVEPEDKAYEPVRQLVKELDATE